MLAKELGYQTLDQMESELTKGEIEEWMSVGIAAGWFQFEPMQRQQSVAEMAELVEHVHGRP